MGLPPRKQARAVSALALASLCLAVFAAAAAGTGWVRHVALRHALLDLPNERSSHASPTPRGAGLAVTSALIVGWLAAAAILRWPAAPWMTLCGLGLGLMTLSWIDDLRGLGAGVRLAAHGLAVAAGLLALPIEAGLGRVLPLWAEGGLAFLAWAWFVNLYNFMDGIDGLAGIETASLGAGIALIAAMLGHGDLVPLGLMAAAAAAGFLWWNWHPAKIFLGDSGSVPLGYLLGGLLVILAARGQWAPALILPAAYVADASLTLLRRALRGEKFWQAHRQHAYQQAVQAGLSHAEVSRLFALTNLALIAAAAWAASGQIIGGLVLGALITAALIAYLLTRKRP
jgi:UDP-N-acetylmuramyl pentapeptide phosphotransferase/UDP-N-acetylglucosamine-1-phosphate transferase